ncbi:MAG: ornithine carbamoyltransferase [Planctomycetota bacterium]|nr:ornithine carbamoyltransferase [Planctomycetota bacterium]
MSTLRLGFKDFLTVGELDGPRFETLAQLAASCKRDRARHATALAGRSVVMLFEKPSLRTRVSFEVGIAKLGGHALYYDHSKERIGERESVHDYARNLERWADAVVARTFSHEVLEELAGYSRVPVINALSDEYHPCQALADLFTLREHVGPLAGRRLAFVGDGNNVCASLIILAATLGMRVTVIGPEGYEPAPRVLETARARAASSGGTLQLSADPAAVRGADAVYTDAWTSMGWEAEAQHRRKVFAPYQVTPSLMALAGDGARFMHCLPAHRGEEVTDEVIDSPRSIVFDQAENRMHVQNALLIALLAPESVR